MEARSLPSRTAPSAGRKALLKIRHLAGRWGLVAVLLAFPIYFAAHDLFAGYGGYSGGHATHIHDLTYLGTNIVQGISNGAIWSLIAIGYTLVYGIIELINFAHGDVFMIGSMTGVSFWSAIGLGLTTSTLGLVVGLPIALVVCMIVCGALNVLIERVGYRPLRGAPRLAPLITAVGFSFILQNVGLLWRGGSTVGVSDLVRENKTVVQISGVVIHRADVLSVVVTIPLVILLGMVRRPHASRQGDARHRAGPRGRAADGDQRRLDDLADVPHRWSPGRRRRTRIRALRDDDLVPPGVRGGADRVHGSGDGRNRQHQGSRASAG